MINFGDPQDNNMPLSIEFYYEDFEAQLNGPFRETSFSIYVESSRNADVKPYFLGIRIHPFGGVLGPH